jgi:cystathionine beta-lyase
MVVALPGVVPGIYAFFLALGERGKNFLTHTPVYPYFLSGGNTAGMSCVQVPLKADDRRYSIDFDAMEKAATPDTRAILLCNPHNPAGRNFGLDELSRILEFANRRNLMVCSDEIWADWNLDGKPFIPFFELGAEAARRTVVLGAATKTFNIPGLGGAWAIIPNAELREKFRLTIQGLLPSANYMGLLATTWVQEKGEAWFNSVRQHVIDNRRFAEDYISGHFPQVAVTRSESTYLMWLDFRETPFSQQPAGELLRRARVALSEGALFGEGGAGFARINLGTSREVLAEALERIFKALQTA